MAHQLDQDDALFMTAYAYGAGLSLEDVSGDPSDKDEYFDEEEES